jgi:hypothetical protein
MERLTPMWMLAMLAVLVLASGCGVTASERWVYEERVEVEALAGPEFHEQRAIGHLELQISQETRTTRTPIERKYIEYRETYSNVDWEEVGFMTAVVVCSVLLLFVYALLFAFGEWEIADDD